MPGRLIVITGTDTGIGKTHLGSALLLAARSQGHAVIGYKPVESGVDGSTPTDAHRLRAASTPALFHVQPPAVALRAPVSPHLAAAREGVSLPWSEIATWIARTRSDTVLLVELPGGLFTPLSPSLLNVDAVNELRPDLTVLVAPDRLGVLNHVLATLAGAKARGAAPGVIALVAPEHADASTGTNAAELNRLTDTPILGPWPRATAEELAAHPATLEVTRRWIAR